VFPLSVAYVDSKDKVRVHRTLSSELTVYLFLPQMPRHHQRQFESAVGLAFHRNCWRRRPAHPVPGGRRHYMAHWLRFVGPHWPILPTRKATICMHELDSDDGCDKLVLRLHQTISHLARRQCSWVRFVLSGPAAPDGTCIRNAVWTNVDTVVLSNEFAKR
jgi:hypothetical protein